MSDRNRYSDDQPSSWWEREGRWRERETDRPNERGSFAREPDWRSGWRAADDPWVEYGEADRHASEAQDRERGYTRGEYGRDYGPARPYRADRAQNDFGGYEQDHRPTRSSGGGSRSDYDGGYGSAERAERSFRPEPGGYHNPRRGTGRYAYGWREDRGWWDHTKDRIAGAFGDSDAQRRADWDSYQRDARDGEHRGKGPKGYSRSDDRVREDVSDRLSDDSWLDASSIEVAAKAGEVTLSGTVMSRGDKRRAEDLADSVSGVSNVQNNLRVHPGGDVYGVDTRPTASGPTTGKVS